MEYSQRGKEYGFLFICWLFYEMMTPPLTLTTAMQIAAAYGGDEL